MTEIPKRPDVVISNYNHSMGSDEELIKHEHAVAVRAVEWIRSITASDSGSPECGCVDCRTFRFLREIEVSGWRP